MNLRKHQLFNHNIVMKILALYVWICWDYTLGLASRFPLYALLIFWYVVCNVILKEFKTNRHNIIIFNVNSFTCRNYAIKIDQIS